MRIVLDSNILVRAAWKADGLASRLLRSVLEGPHRLIVSPFILGEVARVLAYPRIQARWGLSEERIQEYVNHLGAVAEIVHTAIAGRADVLCTRDSHLLDPRIAQYFTQRGIRMMDDIELYSILTGCLERSSVRQP